LLTSARSISIIVAIVVVSICFLFSLNRIWATEERRLHNDIVGWQITVIGTTYAVIVGFMLYAVWGNFQAAEANADVEANALVVVSRLADGLPQDQRKALQSLSEQYAAAAIHEWPAIGQTPSAPDSEIVMRQMWDVISRPESVNAAQQVNLDHAIATLTVLTDHRRARFLESRTGLPDLLWNVLIIGAVLTISSACFFGTKSLRLHLVQVCGLSLLVGMSLVAIAEIDHPFKGSVHVSPDAFVFAQHCMQLENLGP
jgi:hypothetical protein